jgi:probable HAF family extracellular repeat protein
VAVRQFVAVLLALLAALPAVVSGQVPSQQMRYSLVDLGTLGGGSDGYAVATGINNARQITGFSTAGDGSIHGFLYSGGAMKDLGLLAVSGYTDSFANAVNDLGQVVGEARGDGVVLLPRAVRYNGAVSGPWQDLGLPAGGTEAIAWAVSNSGAIVGQYSTGTNTAAFLRSSTGTFTDLGTLPDGTGARAFAVNSSNWVVGEADVAGLARAFLHDGSRMIDLGTLQGTAAAARAVNDKGEIVGSSRTQYDLAEHAFIYQNGAMQDIQSLAGTNYDFSVANAINNAQDRRLVVGEFLGNDGARGFVYDTTTKVWTDLNAIAQIPAASGLVLRAAVDVADDGSIAAVGFYGSDSAHDHAFLLVPGPVGATWTGTAGDGKWGAQANWGGAAVPELAGDAAILPAPAANTTISLDVARTLGRLTFHDDAGRGYTLAAGAGGTLSMNNGGGKATIALASGDHAIAAPLRFAGNTDIAAGAGTLTLDGPLTWQAGATVQINDGRVTFAGETTGTQVGGGATLQIQSGATFQAASGSVDPFTDSAENAVHAAVVNHGTFQVDGLAGVAGISGSGSTSVGTAGHLTADSIQQDTLSIAAGGSVTIRATAAGDGLGDSNPVPEPGTWVLLVAGGLGLLPRVGRKRVRRK